MEVIVNQQTVTVKQQCTLIEALSDYGISQPKGVAVAVNDAVIPQQQWGSTPLYPNDRIIIIKAAQGG